MLRRCCALLCAACLWCAAGVCSAEECRGKLDRVDRNSVTIRSSEDKATVIRADTDQRISAAPYIGKRVSVKFMVTQGARRFTGICPVR